MTSTSISNICRRVARRAVCGYFAPLTALLVTHRRGGSYIKHLKAIYRLTFWQGG